MSSTSGAVHSGSSRLRALAEGCAGLGLALVAGLIVWGVVQGVHPVFHVPKEYEAPSIGMPPEVYLANRRARERVERQHAMLYVGLLGLLVAGVLGLREGCIRRSIWPAIPAAPLGALGGAAGGLLGSLTHEYIYEHYGQPKLEHTVEEQLCVLVPLGLGVGVGLALSALRGSDRLKTIAAATAGGAIAALAFPVIVSVVLPQASTDMLLPQDRQSRLLWFGLASGLIGFLVPVTRPVSATPSPSAELRQQAS